jgi:hypothetical protein
MWKKTSEWRNPKACEFCHEQYTPMSASQLWCDICAPNRFFMRAIRGRKEAMVEQVNERWSVWCEHADGRRYRMGDAAETRWSQETAEHVASHLSAYEVGTFVAQPCPPPPVIMGPFLTVGALRAKLASLPDTMRVAVEITDESEDLVQAELRLADVESRCNDGEDEDAEWLYLWGDASGHADD